MYLAPAFFILLGAHCHVRILVLEAPGSISISVLLSMSSQRSLWVSFPFPQRPICPSSPAQGLVHETRHAESPKVMVMVGVWKLTRLPIWQPLPPHLSLVSFCFNISASIAHSVSWTCHQAFLLACQVFPSPGLSLLRDPGHLPLAERVNEFCESHPQPNLAAWSIIYRLILWDTFHTGVSDLSFSAQSYSLLARWATSITPLQQT